MSKKMESVPYHAVEKALHEARILDAPEERPYEQAKIMFANIALADFRPTQLYGLENHLRSGEKFRENVQNQIGEDTLNMRGGVLLKDSGQIVLPPIVEETENGFLLLDGLHRSALAANIGKKSVGALIICETKNKFSLEKFKLPNDWDEISWFADEAELGIAVDQGFAKRRTVPGAKNYYRDFSHFTNIERVRRVENEQKNNLH